jgi:hypothetical protein
MGKLFVILKYQGGGKSHDNRYFDIAKGWILNGKIA